jgi:tetratricopeptide (TPR) repeat protein
MKARRLPPQLILAALLLATTTVAAADPATSIRQGRAALDANHPQKALAAFQQALDKIAADPPRYAADRVAALAGKGYAALWLGNEHQAETAYRQGLTIARSEADQKTMAVGLARALIGLGRPREAYDMAVPYRDVSHEAALQAAIAANLLGWNVLGAEDLMAAAPDGVYPGPHWLKSLYRYADSYVQYGLAPKVNIGIHYSSDIDHNINQIYSADVRWPGKALSDPRLNPTFWQFGYQQTQITDSVGQTGLSAIRGGWSSTLDRNWQYQINAGVGTSGHWTYGTVDSQLFYTPSDSWGLNLGVDRQPIRTFTAVQNRILVNTVDAGGFYRLRDVGTVGVDYFHQSFSDGNQRNGLVIKATPEFLSLGRWPVSLGIQGYYRQYHSGVVPYDGYFNPRNYREAIGYLIYVQKFSPYWTLRFYSGFGSQTIDGATSSVRDFFGTLSGLIAPYCAVSLTGGYSQIANAYGGGPGYHRSYIEANIAIPF